MTDFDLLNAVQPDSGWYAVVGIKDGKPIKQVLVATREEVDATASTLASQQWNVFFGVAKYATSENRTKANVQALKSFWLDIDCGEGKPHLTQEDGAAALHTFFNLVGLPKPILVNSGRGLHVYWPLTEAITREQWEPVAARLHELCITHELHADPACFEVARILRIPGTYNFKGSKPLEVTVVSKGKGAMSYEDFKQILGVKTLAPFPDIIHATKQRELTALGKSLQDNSISNFAKIMKRGEDGCKQLISAYVERADISEPRWFSALSIAKFCDDKTKAIHLMSSGYPEYDPAATEDKIRHIVGPHTCAVIERNNPGGCVGCPHLGKVKSPIMLGRMVLEAEPQDNVVVAEDDDGEEDTFIIPEYPWPFFRGKNGGIYIRAESEEEEPSLVYENDFYVVKRMRDPVLRDVVVMRLHMPMDGVREFIVPMAQVVEGAELRKLLASEGVACGKKRFEHLTQYVLASVSNLQNSKKAEQMRLQFGWADNDSKFILGDTEISAEGAYHSPPSSITTAIAANIGPVGDFTKWKEVFALYGRPGLEPHAFAALTAFGTPLFKFLGQKGALVNVIHSGSGTGKTTILHMCNSVYGSPDRLCAVKEDTLNTKIMRIGIHCNLPVTFDEMTNTTPQDFSTLTYNVSQGRGKDRMKASANEMRLNSTSWQTIALCSSNASFYEKLASMKTSPDGEMMRLIEYKIDYTNSIEPAIAKHMFDHVLMENYGHAGPVYISWLVRNLEEAKATALSIQAKIDRELKLTPRERFWSAVLAANITGGLIAKQLELIDWDMKRIYKWATDMLWDLRTDVEPPSSDAVTLIGDYINRHMQNILVVNEGVDARSNTDAFPQLEPRGELLIRWEPDTKKMFISAKAFKNDCSKVQINYKETLQELKEKGIFVNKVVKRISKGMKVASPPTYCLEFDGNNGEFFSIDELIKPELENAGRAG